MKQMGNFKASISDVFMGQSKANTPYFCIMFKTPDGEEYPWQVYLHNKFDNQDAKDAAMNAMETLALLGFKGSRVSDLAEGSVDDLFSKIDKEIKIVVIEDKFERKDKDGETMLNEDGSVKYGSSFKVKSVYVGNGYNKVDKKQAVVLTKSLPYDGWFASAKKSNPIKQENLNKTPQGFTTEDIPF